MRLHKSLNKLPALHVYRLSRMLLVKLNLHIKLVNPYKDIDGSSDYFLKKKLYTPVTLLEQEAGFLSAVLLVALRLVDAVAVARVLSVQILLGINTIRRLSSDNNTLQVVKNCAVQK